MQDNFKDLIVLASRPCADKNSAELLSKLKMWGMYCQDVERALFDGYHESASCFRVISESAMDIVIKYDLHFTAKVVEKGGLGYKELCGMLREWEKNGNTIVSVRNKTVEVSKNAFNGGIKKWLVQQCFSELARLKGDNALTLQNWESKQLRDTLNSFNHVVYEPGGNLQESFTARFILLKLIHDGIYRDIMKIYFNGADVSDYVMPSNAEMEEVCRKHLSRRASYTE